MADLDRADFAGMGPLIAVLSTHPQRFASVRPERERALTLAPRTAQLLHVVVKACFASAVKKKLIPTNPVADAERPARDGEPNETILDEQELGHLVKGFEGRSLYPIVAVAAYTGMRRNEILALAGTRTSTLTGP
jgi:integrase